MGGIVPARREFCTQFTTNFHQTLMDSRNGGLQARFGNQGLRVLSVSLDKHVHRVDEMVRGMQLTFPVLLDTRKKIARLYDPGKMPLTVLIDPAGTVRYIHEGFHGQDVQTYTAEVEQLLADYGPLTDQG